MATAQRFRILDFVKQPTQKADPKRSFWQRLADAWFGYDYFIAHRTQDGGNYAAALYERLRAKGNELDCFLDQKHYPAGQNLRWLQSLAVQKTSRLVVVVTAGAHDSDHVLSEVQEFKKRRQGKTVVPIGTRDTLAKEAFPESRLLPELPQYPADICILESPGDLSVGPSDKTVEKLLNDFSEERKATKRIRALKVIACVLFVLMVAAVGLGWAAYVQSERRAALLREASRSDYTLQLR